MTRVLVDADLRKKLHGLTRSLELCDESGTVLAQVKPVIDYSEWEPQGPQVSDEELERRARSNEKTYTTAEVLAYLEKLSCSESSGSKQP